MAGVGLALALTACGGNARQDANEPSGRFDVEIPTASFPASQGLAQHTHLTITVRNSDTRTIPDIAVTITDPGLGTSAQPFSERLSDPSQYASASRPVWIVDRAPDPSGCQYSCQQGGVGGAATAYSNTWALGALAPGKSVTFDWSVTAVKAGVHLVKYQIAAGLNGLAKAQLADGRTPEGIFHVTVHTTPVQSYVNNRGQVVNTP